MTVPAATGIRLWRDHALGQAGVDLLAGDACSHRYRPHSHDETVIAVFTAGAQDHRIGRHAGTALPGSLMLIPAGEVHTGEAHHRAGNWSYRAFYPDRETLAAIAGDLFAGSRAGDVHLGTQPLHEDARLARRLAAWHRLIERESCDPLARQQAFFAAMAAVLRRHAEGAGMLRAPGEEPRAIRRAIEYARARFARADLDIVALASAAELSPYHFMRSFRGATGLTAHIFVIQLRLAEARRLLAAGTPAAEAALAAGFADQSHLIRQFRTAFGLTPGQYVAETRSRSATAPSLRRS